MKKTFFIFLLILQSTCFISCSKAQGWPEQYGGVVLQGFYWDSFSASKWTKLKSQADELAEYFNLVWIPQSGYCGGGNSMGYMPLYYFNQNSSFGTENELRSMIATFKEKGLGTIADVVINHRANVSNWVDFPKETYKGETYQMVSTDICKDDDGGACLKWATANGYQLSANNDSGEGWSGGRDIDHKSENVNTCVKAYLDFLLNDLGYAGFRYDMVKGYSSSFTADYNNTAKPQFSVGECWDGTTTIKNWINGTKVDGKPTSAAFDFQFRYRVRDAVNAKNWTKLTASSEQAAGKPLVFDQNFKRYAVTFVENHDTERRSNSEQDPLKADTLAANAFMMAMPGTPCVFFKHWIAAKGDIKRMIAARKLVGIHNQSEYEQKASNTQYYAVQTTGTQGQLICVVGSNPKGFAKPDGFTQIIERNDFIYYVSDKLASQWNEIEKRIVEEQKAQEEVFTPYTATIYVRDELGWTRMNYYIWDSNNNTQLNGGWPGKQITDKKTVNGYEWYYQTFNIDKAGYYVNVVFSTNSGSPQTVDVTEIKDDKFYVIKRDMNGSKYLVEEDTETSAISMVEDDGLNMDNASYYSLDGRKVNRPVKGIYIIRSGNKAKTILIK
ncbi:MAG: starch-binding protein [Bacteroidaceae bacterium]|nr:starch-binding protein [Bacteroidaceae bacterium]